MFFVWPAISPMKYMSSQKQMQRGRSTRMNNCGVYKLNLYTALWKDTRYPRLYTSSTIRRRMHSCCDTTRHHALVPAIPLRFCVNLYSLMYSRFTSNRTREGVTHLYRTLATSPYARTSWDLSHRNVDMYSSKR